MIREGDREETDRLQKNGEFSVNKFSTFNIWVSHSMKIQFVSIYGVHIKEWKGKTESNNVVCILMCQIRLSEKGEEVCDCSVRRLLGKVCWNFILQFCICCHALERNDCKFARLRRSSFFYANKKIDWILFTTFLNPFFFLPLHTKQS